jgi:hypothetical protein
MFIQVLYPGSDGISFVATTISTAIFVIIILGPLAMLLLFILSVIPFRLNPQGQWLAIAVLVFIQIVLILVTIAFQMRTSWLWRVMETESLI